jgi:two-component system, response regulator
MNVDPVDILLVEDNPADRELTLRTLGRVNLANAVRVAKDGPEALEAPFGPRATPHPKLVLLDLKLPKVDGLEVLRRIRSEEATRLVPVVVLTSSHEEQDIVRSYELGTNSYVVKPVEFEAFAQAVADLGLYGVVLNRNPSP